MPMPDQFHPCIHDFIENIVDFKADGNYVYRAIVGLYEELKRLLLADELSMVYMFFVTYSWISFFVNNTN